MMLSEDILQESAYYKKILNKGIEKGRLEGQRGVLRRLFVQRFGVLTAAAEEQIQTAAQSDLDRWADRLFTATSIDDLLT
jgi:predicted transposase YdaD